MSQTVGSTVGGNTAEMYRRREEIEAREARQNKSDFIEYCTDVLTQHKQSDKGNTMPDKRQKHRVLQKVISDPKILQRDEGREPTVEEYGKFIKSEVRNTNNST